MFNQQDFIKKIAKVELHLHIEGSLEPELMFKLAKRNNITLPYASVDDLKKLTSLITYKNF